MKRVLQTALGLTLGFWLVIATILMLVSHAH